MAAEVFSRNEGWQYWVGGTGRTQGIKMQCGMTQNIVEWRAKAWPRETFGPLRHPGTGDRNRKHDQRPRQAYTSCNGKMVPTEPSSDIKGQGKSTLAGKSANKLSMRKQ